MKTDAKKEREYGQMALDYVRRTQLPQLPTIRPNTPEWSAWRRYFVEHLGFLPYIMQLREDFGDGEMTVPAELPEKFDGSYQSAIDLYERLHR